MNPNATHPALKQRFKTLVSDAECARLLECPRISKSMAAEYSALIRRELDAFGQAIEHQDQSMKAEGRYALAAIVSLILDLDREYYR